MTEKITNSESELTDLKLCICDDPATLSCPSLKHNCICLDYGSRCCKADHALTVAEEGVQGTVVCPVSSCRSECWVWEDEVPISDTEKAAIAYCTDCNIDFLAKDGTIVEAHTSPLSVQDQRYYCSVCDFSTEDISAKLKHERETPVKLIGTISNLISRKAEKIVDSGPKTETKTTKTETKSDPHYCVNNPGGDKDHWWKCKYCSWTGSKYSSHENDEGKQLNNWNTTTYTPACTHPPFHLIDGGVDGWNVYIGKKWDCEPLIKNHDHFFNLSGTRVGKEHDLPGPLKHWQGGKLGKSKEWMINWPDFGIVSLPIEFWDQTIKWLKNNKLKLLVCCMGGHGRTGTAAACLLIAGCGMKPKDAIKWVKENYCKDAIESVIQMKYIYYIGGEEPPEMETPKNATKKEQRSLIYSSVKD